MTDRVTRTTHWRVLLPVLAIPLFTIVAVAAYYTAMNPFHNNSYDGREACIVFGGLPQGTVMEEVQNPTTSWPLGFMCEHGDTVIAWQNWPATIVSYASWLIVLMSVGALVVLLLRRRFASPRIPAVRHAIARELTDAALSVPALAGLVVILAALGIAVVSALIDT